MQHRCRRDDEGDFVAAVFVLQVLLPDLLAVEIEAEHVAGGELEPNVFTVGDRRDAGGIAFAAAHHSHGFVDHVLPLLFTVSAKAVGDVGVAVGRGQKDVLVPDGGRGGGFTGHRHAPLYVLGGPARRHIFLVADPVAVGTAPGRPVFSQAEGRKKNAKSKDDGTAETVFHVRILSSGGSTNNQIPAREAPLALWQGLAIGWQSFATVWQGLATLWQTLAITI